MLQKNSILLTSGPSIQKKSLTVLPDPMEEPKKRRVAAAIRYDGTRDAAPRVTARGQGMIADRIIELAMKNGIPIKNDPALVQILSKLDIDEQIPEELYRAVAEILSFIYSVNSDYRDHCQELS
ncbi:MAG: EscU/YscU/HrcU family type III secretion system export apparatus switch protein [Syntrophus sp. (in: bacteria)]|nr:EscU/YscU/HrcU family type III secretion system export apparatus switch protein [Syntrophus sp. (in: bacteria)]